MYIELLADTKEDIDQSKPMLVFFCVPHNTEAIRANIRFLIGQLGKTRHYISPNPNAKFKYTASKLDGIEVCFMCNELLERLVKSVEEIEFTNKAHLAQLRGDKKVKWFIDKPAKPTTEVPNPQITVASDSVFQVSSLLENSNITEIMSIALLDDGTIGLPDLNPFNLESKVDKIRTDITAIRNEAEKLDPRLGTTNTYLGYLYQAFYAGVDIMPLIDQSIFTLMRNALFSTGFLVDESHLKKHNQLLENGLFQSSTISYSNSWLAKLGSMGDIYGWLTSSDGVLKVFFENVTQIRDYLDYHLGEVQYGIKHFFNIFAMPTRISEIDPDLKGHKIPRSWPKPNTETQLELLQDSVFQGVVDFAGRGFNLYDWLTMWVKPHGDNANGVGWNNPYTNRKGHELVTGSNEQLDTFIDRFSLAFLQTSNTTPILGKIRDALVTGLLFSDSLSLLTMINNTLGGFTTAMNAIKQAIRDGLMLSDGQNELDAIRIHMSHLPGVLQEIADKDCCSDNGSTTVTNPDGSTTTTPNNPVYPPVDPNDPDNGVTQEPYEKPPLTQANDADAVCGFIWYTLDQCAEWLDWLISWLPSVDWVLKAFGLSGFAVWVAEQAIKWENVYLSKLGAVAIKGIGSKWLGLAGVAIDMLPDYIREIRDDLSCGSQRTDVKVDELETEIIEALQALTLQNQVLDFAAYCIHIFYSYGLYSPLENATGINIADYAQYCPCPSDGCGTCGNPAQGWTIPNFTTPSNGVQTLQAKPPTGFEVQYYDMTIGLSGIGAKDCVKDCKFDWAGGTTAPAWNGTWNPGGWALMNAEPSEANNTSIVSWSVGATSVTIRVGIYRRPSDGGNHIRLSEIWLGTCQG